MTSIKNILFLAAASAAMVAAATPAAAAGCNGVVNPFVWGCAFWDNNNGPKYPYYKKQQVYVPAKGARIETHSGVQMVQHQGKWLPIVAVGAGNIVAVGAGN